MARLGPGFPLSSRGATSALSSSTPSICTDRVYCGVGHPDAIGFEPTEVVIYVQLDNGGALFFSRNDAWVQVA